MGPDPRADDRHPDAAVHDAAHLRRGPPGRPSGSARCWSGWPSWSSPPDQSRSCWSSRTASRSSLVNDPVVLTVAHGRHVHPRDVRGARWVVSIWVAHAALRGGLVALNVAVFGCRSPRGRPACSAARWSRRSSPGGPGPAPAYGAVAGGAMTLGMLGVEYLWTQATRPMPWPAEMMPWAVLFAGLAAWASAWWRPGCTGSPPWRPPRPPRPRCRHDPHVGARRPLGAARHRRGTRRVRGQRARRRTPPGLGRRRGRRGPRRPGPPHGHRRPAPGARRVLVRGAVLAGRRRGARRARATGPGVWRTDEPMPLAGDTERCSATPLHGLAARPEVYLPADPAIPAAEHPAVSGPRPGRRAGGAASRGEAGRPRLALGRRVPGVVGSLFLRAVRDRRGGLLVRRPARRRTAQRGSSPSPSGSPARPPPSPRWPRRSPACRGGSPDHRGRRVRTHDGLRLHGADRRPPGRRGHRRARALLDLRPRRVALPAA